MDYKDFTIQGNAANHFWYKARRALINDLLSVIFKNYDRQRSILEIGCGLAYQMPVLEKWGRVEGFDINTKAVAVAKRNGFNVKVKDLESDDLRDYQPDTICLFDVLEHIKNDREAVKKIHLALKSNGYLFLTVPAYNFMFSSHDKALDHFRRYDKNKLVLLLENAGFKVVRSGYWNSLMFPGILLMRVLKRFLTLFIKKESYRSEAFSLPPIINGCLYRVLMLENFLLRKNIKFHWGLSIFIIAKKS